MVWDTAGAWGLGERGSHPCSDARCLSEPAPVKPIRDTGAEAVLPTQVKSWLPSSFASAASTEFLGLGSLPMTGAMRCVTR